MSLLAKRDAGAGNPPHYHFSNPGTEHLEIIEVQTGSYLGENEIVRFEDLYERH